MTGFGIESADVGLPHTMPNYIVRTSNASGRIMVPCDTTEEVWLAVGLGSVGAPYSVSSPKGLDVNEFVPF